MSESDEEEDAEDEVDPDDAAEGTLLPATIFLLQLRNHVFVNVCHFE